MKCSWMSQIGHISGSQVLNQYVNKSVVDDTKYIWLLFVSEIILPNSLYEQERDLCEIFQTRCSRLLAYR